MMTARHARHAFTVVEMLVALIVTALLLTAIAMVMHASLFSYKENEQIATVTQTARSILGRMSRDIRTAQAISYSGGLMTIIPPDNGSGISQIQYELSGSTLIYRVTKSGVETTQNLVAPGDDVNINSFAITEETGHDWQGLDCTKSLALTVVFTMDGKDYPFTATARPRRNIVY